MADFPQVRVADNWNPLASFYDSQTTSLANDLARNTLGSRTRITQNAADSGTLANQLASNTLGSNTQIAANTAESGGLANRQAAQKNPLEITSLRQQLGLDPSPTLDRQRALYNSIIGQPGATSPPAPTDGSATPGSGTEAVPGLGSRESGNDPSRVNDAGYSGMFQHGTARLADIGAYTPANGESLKTNQWKGTLNIPGFPEVKTQADYLKSPGAQRAAMAMEVANTDQAIAATPGADKFNPNGLRAVAHLGGVAGMQRFVSSGGLYDPADSNGTKLSDYYKQFAQGGVPALQAAFGHPDGHPNAPQGQQQAAAPGVTLAPDPSAPPALAPVQVAGPGAPTGSPPVNQPAPGTQGVDAVMAQLRAAGQPASGPDPTQPAAPAPAPPQIPNPNDLLATGAPDGAAPPQNGLAALAPPPQQRPQLMPAASAQPPPAPAAQPPAAQPGTGMNSAQVQEAQRLLRGAAQIELEAAQTPNDPRAKATAAAMAADLRGRASVLMQADSVTTDKVTGIQTHSLTGKQDSAAEPVHNPARVTKVDNTRGGTLLTQPGAPDRVIPYGGRPEQTDAYKADLPRVEALTTAAQSAQASMPRLNEMADLAGQLATGPTAELRAKGAAMLEAAGASPERIKAWTGMSSGSQAQEFVKLAIATAGSSAKADVGANNGIQSTQLYQAANPNLSLLPDANKRITNMMRVSAQQIQGYAQAALEHFGTNEATFLKGGDYNPLTTFNRQWQAQHNPQIGAAATGILNGDSFDKWSAKITPAEGARAAALAASIDPTVMVPMKGGGMRPVGQILAHPAVSGAPAPAAN